MTKYNIYRVTQRVSPETAPAGDHHISTIINGDGELFHFSAEAATQNSPEWVLPCHLGRV